MYDQATGFLNIPPLQILIGKFVAGQLESELIIKLVFPLLASVGVVQVAFLSFHIRYMISAKTTLEHKILLDKKLETLIQQGEEFETPPNPFDNGWWENVKASLGENLFMVFLPVPIFDGGVSYEKKST
jgi:hypothetical protein